MRALALILLLAVPVAAASDPAPEVEPLPGARLYEELPPGRYAMSLTGLVSTVCARAIAAEWMKLPEVDKASVDFAHSSAVVSVRLDTSLKVAVLRKALKRAEKLAGLGGHYDIREIAYRTK